MAVRKTLRQYKNLQTDLNERLEELELKRQVLHTSISSVCVKDAGFLGEANVDMGSTRESSNNLRQIEMKKARLKATEVLLDILQLKMSFINDVIDKLQLLMHDNPNQLTPFPLQFSRFYDWVETSQQLYELNTQLYEIEKSKWSMQGSRRQQPTLDISTPVDHSLLGTHPNITDALSQLGLAASSISLYVSERLQPRDHRMTFEASKIEEYVTECDQYQGGTLQMPQVDSSGVVRGAHPQSYHAFIEVLCNYIVERHKSSQGEDLPYANIYTAIEHNLMPRIKHYVHKYVSKAEDDRIIQEQCLKFSDITLSQLRIPLALRSDELIPFADAVAHMKATYFSQSPTDKMYSVVAAAKALHEQLRIMEEGSIDGDTFLDFWVYVTIKANVRDMATNVEFMSEYGNPQLSIAEAGYYLTTLSAAMSYIKTLTPEMLQKQEENNSQFLLCDSDTTKLIASQEGSCMEIIGQKELLGYVPAAIKKWLMDKSRPFSTVLVQTGDITDKVQVNIVRLSSNNSSPKHVEYFYEMVTSFDVPGLSCRSVEDGYIVLADIQLCGDKLLILDSSKTLSEQLQTVQYAIQLIRLGSETLEDEDQYPAALAHSTSSSPFSIIPSVESSYNPKREAKNQYSVPSNSHLQTNFHLKRSSHRQSSDGSTPGSEGLIVTAEVYTPDLEDIEPDRGKALSTKSRVQELMDTSHNSMHCSELLSLDNIAYLEQNYLENHMYGNQSHSVRENTIELTKQCQMMLQKLNFLSSVHCLDGQYDNATMNAVQSFQVAHNQQDDFSSIRLPENGYLSIATLQYLRQELLTVFANLMRLRKDVGLDALSSFDPLSTEPADVKRFTDIIVLFQGKLRIPQTGNFCTKTILRIKRLLALQRTFSFPSERGNTL